MTCRLENTESETAVELIAECGLEGLSDALSLLINEAMRLERERHIRASPYERTGERQGYANGYKPKTLRSRMGELSLAVPQVREGGFYPQSLDKGLRSERALKLALAEMYVSGVSTRKVAKVTQQLCGFEVSSTEVSRCAALLDPESYIYTQQVGRAVYDRRHPGIPVNSARHVSGENVDVFNPAYLSNPRGFCYLTYRYDVSGEVQVEREPGRVWLTL